MFTVEGMLAFHSWTQVSYEALFTHAAKLPPELFTKKLEGFGFPSVRDQLLHFTINELFWVKLAQGEDYPDWDKQSFTNAAQIFEAYQPVAEATREWIKSLSPDELNQPRTLDFPDGYKARVSPAGMLHHVLTHGYHHKGQVVAMCRLLGYPAPETDLDHAVLTDA